MCTLVVLYRPGTDWPLLLAGNRDEKSGRPWLAPGRHWPDRPEVVAGLDLHAGGSWLGVNDHGLVAVVMNRHGSLGPLAGKRSRGELVLEALDHTEAGAAAGHLGDIDPMAYRPFNLLVGGPDSVYWLRHRDPAGRAGVEVAALPPGLHMLAAGDLDDATAPRLRIHLPRFRRAPTPDPQAGDWSAWEALLASRRYPPQEGPLAAMNVETPDGFATLCSHTVAVPRFPGFGEGLRFRFAAGPPDRAAFEPVAV